MILSYVRRTWFLYLAGTLFMFVSTYLQTLAPGILGNIVDTLSADAIVRSVVSRLIGLLLLAALGAFITKFIWRYCLVGTARKLECQLREDLFAQLQRLPRTFYHRRKTGELMAYAINDINAVRMTFGPAMAQLLNAVLLTGLCVYYMVRFGQPTLVALSLAPIGLALVSMVLLGRLVRARFTRVQQAFATVSDRIQESITGIRVIKAFARQDEQRRRFEEKNDDMLDASLAMVRVSSLSSPMVQVFFGLSFCASLVLGGRLVLSGGLSLGDFVAFQGYIASIVMPVASIARIVNIYQRGLASWGRLNDVFRAPPVIEDRPLPQLINAAPQGDIAAAGLTFAYEGNDQPALRDVNFRVAKGQTLGIVGHTGSGKTTLANLLVRLYDVPEGALTLDGYPLCAYPLHTLRDAVATVPQDGFLFSASIRDNLLLFGPPRPDHELDRVMEICQMKETLAGLPDGYDTVLGERGVNLSGGQQQRLAIARALLRDAPILVLDDAFSSVDTDTERALIDGIGKHCGDRTRIIIAHRVSAVRRADHILVLQDGSVAEQGSPEELLARDGLFAALCRRQDSEEPGVCP